MRYLYSLIFFLLIPILFARLFLKLRKSKNYQNFSQKGRWKERLGWLPKLQFNHPPIWIHTVSVGEFIAALPLVRLLLKEHPNIPIVVTTTTLTGSDQVKAILGNRVKHVYLPWDVPFAIKRFYFLLNPRVGLIMETEIWPNLIHFARLNQIPLILLNARMSTKSAAGYQKVSSLTKNMLAGFQAICVQSEGDKKRFLELGANKRTVKVTGNIKFDLYIDKKFEVLSKEIKAALKWQQQCVIVAASTHDTEDELILNVFKRLYETFPDLKLIIVPRHPERFHQVYQLCQHFGFTVQKRSEIEKLTVNSIDVLIGDSMGEMMLYYQMGHLVVMGGTFIPNGGHNILEPAALGLPIFYGPSMFNFTAIHALFQQHQAALQVSDKETLFISLVEHLSEFQLAEKLGKNAFEIMKKNIGARDKIYQTITASETLN